MFEEEVAKLSKRLQEVADERATALQDLLFATFTEEERSDKLSRWEQLKQEHDDIQRQVDDVVKKAGFYRPDKDA